MDEKNWNRYLMWGLTAFAVIAASVGLVFLFINLKTVTAALSKIIGILKPVIYGIIMAYLMAPIYNRVYKAVVDTAAEKGKRRHSPTGLAKFCATLVSVVVLCAVALGIVSMMLPELYKSVMNVINSLPANIEQFTVWLNGMLTGESIYQNEILALYNSLVRFGEDFVNNRLTPNLTQIIGQTYTGVMSVMMWFYDIIIGLIVMIYLLNIKEVLLPQSKKLVFTILPKRWAELVIEELQYINTVFGGFIIGKIVDSLIIGAMCFVILNILNAVGILRMPYILLVSVIIGVTNVIPFFGPFIGAIPATILIALYSPIEGLKFLLFVFLLQQFDGNFLGPKILGDRTGISSFWVLFSILLFGGLFGFVGMIIAVPTWAVFMNLLARVSAGVLRKKGLPEETEAYRRK